MERFNCPRDITVDRVSVEFGVGKKHRPYMYGRSGGRTWVHPCTASHRFLDFESKLPCRGCFARVIWACVPGPVERKSERKSDYGPVRATLQKRSTSIHCKKKLDARYVYVVYVRVTTCMCCCFSRALERRKLGTL